MIEFVSLFFGLVAGAQPVDLAVAGSVATVELRLNGETVARQPVAAGSGVRAEVDFGRRLRPHELVAIARDGGGRELDRRRLWINLVADEGASASLVFAGGERGLPRQVGVVWESFGQRRPEAVEMAFDGRPLAVEDPARVPLPAYDPETMHFVTATVRFRGDRVSRLEAGFGGGPGAVIETELTAVAVTVARGTRLPAPRAMRDWFSKRGERIAVHGVERSAPEVVVVRDPSARAALAELTTLLSTRDAARDRHVRQILAPDQIAGEVRVRLVSPVAAPLPTDRVSAGMFARGPIFDAGENGFLWLAGESPPATFPPALASAVALAGLHAHTSRRPRAVVLLLGAGGDDDRFSAAEARRFLDQLQVPLFVLRCGEGEPSSQWRPDAVISAAASSAYAGVERAFEPVRAHLKSQRIVWLEGRHLPQEIELSPEVERVRLVGRGG